VDKVQRCCLIMSPEPRSANAESGLLPGLSLTGRTALVTGGASGIGLAICRDLKALGAQVIVADHDFDAAEAAASQLGEGVAVEVELADIASVEGLLGAPPVNEGRIDILVNNASATLLGRFTDSDPETWEEQWLVNLRSPMRLAHALSPFMAARGWGRVIFISSDSARVGMTGEAVYASCKAGLLGLSKTLARELARKGVTSNVICPGVIDTPTSRAILGDDEKLMASLTSAIPLKRMGTSEEVSGIIALLCSERGAYITGQTISVNGGIAMV
jgi:2-hydroxycyclohexanecarboxyl-CoA dehydrogenase